MADFIKSFALLYIFILIQVQRAKCQNIYRRIMSGSVVKIEDAPFYAGLADCGAVIISDTWILTAAHCVQKQKPMSQRHVWVGGESFANSQRVPYGSVIIHQAYTKLGGIPVHDIALVRLNKPLKFSNKVQPAQLPVGSTRNPKLVVIGRGMDETGHSSKVLKKLDLIQLSTQECLSIIPKEYHAFVYNYLPLFESMNVCAKREADKPTICFGDSGGPLVSGKTLVGLVSYMGGKPCQKLRLGFYVNVATYVPWIKKHTGL